MITSIKIENFKSIASQNFIFKPLTILAGTNSSGKSSVIQSLLFYSYYANKNLYLEEYLSNLGELNKLLNFKAQKEEIKITPSIDNQQLPSLTSNSQGREWDNLSNTKFLTFEKELFYLCANRVAQENIAKKHKTLRSGCAGEYLFGFYEDNKIQKLKNDKLICDTSSYSFSTQVIFWLKKILELKLEPQTQEIDSSNVSILYKNNDLEGIKLSPFNLGAGISYLTKILILGLSLEQGNLFIVENPEVHLHPKAISKLADFFVFLANAGIQVLIETHSEHIINKMRWVIFKEKIKEQDIQIYYRENAKEDFISLNINKRGRYTDKEGKIIKFPKGFFDSDLEELLEMA